MDLKDSADLQRFILNGRVFHSRFGGNKGESSFPYVLRWQRGNISSSLSDKRNDSTGVKSGRIKLDDNIEKGFSGKKNTQHRDLLLPVFSGRVGHKRVPIYGVPFLY